MAAPKGNQFWKARTRHGVRTIMESPEKLQEACIEYFEWIEQNPIIEERVGFSPSGVHKSDVKHPHAMTIWGLSIFLGITSSTWYAWKKDRDDLKPVIAWAEEIIKVQKFSNAAAGLMNANLIAREMGLAEKTIVDNMNPTIIVKPPEGDAPGEPEIFGE